MKTDKFRKRKIIEVVDKAKFDEVMKIRVLDNARRCPRRDGNKIWPFIMTMEQKRQQQKAANSAKPSSSFTQQVKQSSSFTQRAKQSSPFTQSKASQSTQQAQQKQKQKQTK